MKYSVILMKLWIKGDQDSDLLEIVIERCLQEL